MRDEIRDDIPEKDYLLLKAFVCGSGNRKEEKKQANERRDKVTSDSVFDGEKSDCEARYKGGGKNEKNQLTNRTKVSAELRECVCNVCAVR